MKTIPCPHCGKPVVLYKNPVPTVDIIIRLKGGENEGKIILIERKNYPYGWAIPGGFIDYGESAENAAIREAKEETGLKVKLVHLLGVYSDPARDDRHHSISVVYVAEAEGMPHPASDAKNVGLFSLNSLPSPLCFDHAKILKDFKDYLLGCSK